MNYRGKVQGGVVVLDPHVQLPDGLEVVVEPVEDWCEARGPAGFSVTMRNGVPVFPRRESGSVPSLELVNQLRDETA